MNEYAKLIKIHDNLIYAAIKAEDPKMKEIWTYKASVVQTKINEMENKSIESLL